MVFVHGHKLFQLEAEKYVMDKFTINRNSAKGYGSVNFKEGDSFKIYFCLREETKVNLNNVRYSNDGGSDIIEFGMDGILLGVLTSHSKSNYGKGWNEFIATGSIGPSIILSSGRHFITVNITKTDFYGVELDQLEITAEDYYISEEIFKCSLFCDDDITYSNGPARDDMSSALLVRKMLPSVCSNNKNILLPIYHENAKMFLITMMHPKYRSFENNFDDNEKCKTSNNTLWEFTNTELTSSHNIIYSESYSDAVFEYGGSNTSKLLYMKFTFEKESESNFETRLVLQFRQLTQIFLCSCKYKRKDGSWFTLKHTFFGPQKTKYVWQIPADTWSSSNEVIFNILVDHSNITPIVLEYVKLYRGTSGFKTSDVLYSSYDTKIEVITDANENTLDTNTMAVRNVDNNEIYHYISQIVISQRLPWAEIYSPVVKLSRSGELEVLPIAPHGLTEIPFGSSIIIGQNDPRDDIPSAPISSIEIAPEALQLVVKFEDSGSSNMLIKSTWKDTKVIFKDIKTTKDSLQFPLVTVLTNWQYDGNADADHVSANGDISHHIAKGWDKLYGTSFTFFRRCISRRNTQSPDLRLQLINEKDLYLYV